MPKPSTFVFREIPDPMSGKVRVRCAVPPRLRRRGLCALSYQHNSQSAADLRCNLKAAAFKQVRPGVHLQNNEAGPFAAQGFLPAPQRFFAVRGHALNEAIRIEKLCDPSRP